MGRKRGVVSKTDPVNQPRKHAAFLLLAEMGIENAPDGRPYGADTDRILWTMKAAGYVWRSKVQEWVKSDSPRLLTLEQRFWAHVDKRGEDECWEWVNGSFYKHPFKDENTYGQIFFNGKNQGSRRCSWFIHFGEIPEGMNVLHKCDNPPCVNPKHLELGTLQKNALDRYERGRVPPYRGTMVNTARLTDADIPAIRCMRLEGMSYNKIGEKYGISGNSIRDIILGKSWKHVA